MQHALQGNLAVAGHGGGDVGGRGGADGGAVVRGPRHAARAEQVRGGEAAEPAPVRVAGRGEAHGVVEQEVARRVLDGAVAERRADEDLARRAGLARHHEAGEADREGHQRRAAVDGAGQRGQRAVHHGARERGDHSRRAGRWAAAAGERPCRTARRDTQEDGNRDKCGWEGRVRLGGAAEGRWSVVGSGAIGQRCDRRARFFDPHTPAAPAAARRRTTQRVVLLILAGSRVASPFSRPRSEHKRRLLPFCI